MQEVTVSKGVVEEVTKKLKGSVKSATNEEEIRTAFHSAFAPFLEKMRIPHSYEKTIGKMKGRVDALYGQVVIEFKRPGTLSSKRLSDYINQLIRYLEDLSPESEWSRTLGVLFDGTGFVFVQYRYSRWTNTSILPLDDKSIKKILLSLRGLSRKPLVAEELLLDFGPRSPLSQEVIIVLYNQLSNTNSEKVSMLFNEWKRTFKQVCSYSPEKIKGLLKYYKLTNADPEKVLFVVHTYYSLLMKLITSEIMSLYGSTLFGSFVRHLLDARSSNEFINEISSLESGELFKNLGISNFIEASYFSWYLINISDATIEELRRVVETLDEYEPATLELQPEKLRDLFKRLYQNLVPRDVRHKLGEYYTPDWLAELVLDEVGYTGNLSKRVLDPACGSGTFIVLAIKRAKEWGNKRRMPKSDILENILKNTNGIDLNPLAVLAAKANYLIAISDLLPYRRSHEIEIPVYLADSITVSRQRVLHETILYVNTVVGRFTFPESLVKRGLFKRILFTIERSIKDGYSVDELKLFMRTQVPDIKEEELDSLEDLYVKLQNLKRIGKDNIWVALLRNAFAPLAIGEFDYVIGNPPWINWESLPKQYRIETKRLWESYGLTKAEGKGMGKVKRDMAMLFVARCFDRYVKKNGRLAFLIPFTVYKTQAGAGFRKFLATGWTKYKQISINPLKIHDLVTLYPFENATNRTSLLVLEKSKAEKIFPIKCTLWNNSRSKGINQEEDLSNVKKMTKQHELSFIPLNANKPESPWMEITEKAYQGIKKVIGVNNTYVAHAGVYTGLNQIYWVQVQKEQPDGLVLVTNPPIPGQKKFVKEVTMPVEKDLIYPLVRGRNVKKWYVEGDKGWIILPVSQNGNILTHKEMKIKYPYAWKYFLNFFDDLVHRGGEPYKTKLKPYTQKKMEMAEKEAPPFYWLFNVKPALAPYKVVWKRISGAITGKAISFASAVLPPENSKSVVINDSMIMVVTDSEDEAYYLSAILNSSVALLAIASYTYELRQETHIVRYLNIPGFDSKNSLHKKLAQLSQKAHELAKQFYEKNKNVNNELERIEEKINKIVADIYNIKHDELDDIYSCLKILRGEAYEIKSY